MNTNTKNALPQRGQGGLWTRAKSLLGVSVPLPSTANSPPFSEHRPPMLATPRPAPKENADSEGARNTSTVLTRVGGENPISDELRKKLAYCKDGTVYVSQANARDADVQSFIHRLRKQKTFIKLVEVSFSELTALYAQNNFDGATQGSNAQVLKVREILAIAAARRATDVHWVGFENMMRIMFRVDGSLRLHEEHEIKYCEDLLRAVYNAHTSAGDTSTQLQINQDQDGRITSRQLLPAQVSSIRISSGPISGGFEQVWRLTYNDRVASGDLLSLGYTPTQVEIMNDAGRLPYGIIVYGGPTGSGKSTTLQTALIAHNVRAKGALNIYTIEEPVEMPMPGVRQHSTATTSETDEDRQSAFVASVRHLLRRDPNIVMFGEIRDVMTASLAVRVSLAGRLLYATMHGNSVMDLLLRLLTDLDVQPMLATDHTLFACFVSQSLVPKLCPHCSLPAAEALANGHHEHAKKHIERILTSCRPNDTPRFIGHGCEHCQGNGTVGRFLIAEVMRTSLPIMEAIRRGDKASAMMHWLEEGNHTKRMIALTKARRGLIDPLIAELHVGELAALDKTGKPKPIRQVLSYGYTVTVNSANDKTDEGDLS